MKSNTLFVKILGILLFSFSSTSSWANDSFAAAAAGGIYLIQNDKVAMLEEELRISYDHIKVRYKFENQSDQDITNLVGFPLPSIMPFESDRDLRIDEMKNPGNPLKFQLWVNGKKTSFSHQVRAFLEPKQTPAVDVTAELIHSHIPYEQDTYEIIMAFQRLSPEQKMDLLKKGIFSSHEGKAFPLFKLHPIFYWKQHFPAHQVVKIEHRYQPSAGGAIGFPNKEEFCMDSLTIKSIDYDKDQSYSHVDYILTTGANWNGPIRSFHLILEKSKPSQILSLCLPGLQLKKTSPTTFEAWKTNFIPKKDLSILFMNP